MLNSKPRKNQPHGEQLLEVADFYQEKLVAKRVLCQKFLEIALAASRLLLIPVVYTEDADLSANTYQLLPNL